MYDFKRLLVCLDQSDMDDTLIIAAAEYARFGNADHIYFITVVKSLAVPESVKKDFPGVNLPANERIARNLHSRLDQAFAGIDCAFHFQVLEGDPTHRIIRQARDKEIDLIILGKKQYHIGKGVTSRNVVNIAHSSALFVTANSRIEPKTILLPTDFSNASRLALQKAVKIAGLVKAKLTCLHTYEVPTGYHTTGKTYEEFAGIMLKHSEAEFAEFISEEGLDSSGIEVVYLLDKHGHPDVLIREYAATHHYDLVVIGSKGRTALSSVLLGSVAAKLVESDFNSPVLVVKAKADNLGLIDAILQR